MSGKVIVYTGPMFSGKTLALLGAYERAKIAHKKVLAFKPKIDDRFGQEVIKSRRFGEIPAVNIEDISQLKDYEADIYVVDEAQFMKGDVKIIRDMADAGKRFEIAGLDMTAEGKPFGPMGNLMCIADEVHKFTAVCVGCGSDAIYSFYLGKKNVDIAVGNNEYVPYCRACWKKAMEDKEKS